MTFSASFLCLFRELAPFMRLRGVLRKAQPAIFVALGKQFHPLLIATAGAGLDPLKRALFALGDAIAFHIEFAETQLRRRNPFVRGFAVPLPRDLRIFGHTYAAF